MRILFGLFITLLIGFFLLQGNTIPRISEKPIFLQIDPIAKAHQTKINISVSSRIKPSNQELEVLIKDYGNIWAHLNHLFTTNDIIPGKEYYTEAWFKQIANHYDLIDQSNIKRIDLEHDLEIQNWSSDGLVCTAIDRNVILKYIYPGAKEYISKVDLAVVLLFQGDHWRIDGLTVINANPQ